MGDKPEEEKIPPPLFPLDKVLAEMVDILQFAVSNIDKKTSLSTEDLDIKLTKLEHDVGKFDSTVGEKLTDPNILDEISGTTQSLIEKCQFLKDEMGKKLEKVKKAREEAEPGEVPEPAESKEDAVDRKQKGLRRIGRSQRWKQL